MEWNRNFRVPRGGCNKGGDAICMPTILAAVAVHGWLTTDTASHT